MVVGYKKDFRHNYMLIENDIERKAEPFIITMLGHQEIEGMLPVEQKLIDNRILYYYEITAKQSILNIMDKSMLSYEKLAVLCSGIIQTIERAYEYLLPEDDFILAPEYIYIDIVTNTPSLCYLPGYDKNIKDQMTGLLEYLMNKVDYKDKEAVFLVYQLYAASKEEGYTLDHLKEVIHNCRNDRQNIGKRPQDNLLNKGSELQSNEDFKLDQDTKRGPKPSKLADSRPTDSQWTDNQRTDSPRIDSLHTGNLISRKKPTGNQNGNAIPVVMEKVESDEEIACYSVKTFIYAGACISGGIIVFVLSCATGIIFNTFGNRIDYSKLFALLLILFCVEGYLLKKLFDKKNKTTKIIKTQEYIDPREEDAHSGSRNMKNTELNNTIKLPNFSRSINHKEDNTSVKSTITDNNSYIMQEEKVKTKGNIADKYYVSEEEEDFNPTCLLNEATAKSTVPVLKAVDDMNYKDITIASFPFFIGKLKKNVDYCLDNDVVSRFHAKITKEGDRFFLTDLNSMNGTFINQELLQTYQKKEIKSGDEIAFANIKYRFAL